MPFKPNIVGQHLVGDGSLVTAGPWVEIGVGVPSAQQFGTPTVKRSVSRPVADVLTLADSLTRVRALARTITDGVTLGDSCLPQSAGILTQPLADALALADAQTLLRTLARPVPGVGSAQVFGAVSVSSVVAVVVVGVHSAQSFGATVPSTSHARMVTDAVAPKDAGTVAWNAKRLSGDTVGLADQATPMIPQTVPVQGLKHGPLWTIVGEFLSGQRVVGWYGGEQLWGTPIPLPGPVSRTVTGIGSVQQFGVVKAVQIAHPVGVPSAQAFGSVTPVAGPVWITVPGVGSAQVFGRLRAFVIYLWPTVPDEEILVPSIPEEVGLVPSVEVEGELLIPTAEETWIILTPTVEEEEELLLVPTIDR